MLIIALAACGNTSSVSRAGWEGPGSDGWDDQGRYCVPGIGRQAEFAARTGVMLAGTPPQHVVSGGWEEADPQRYTYRITQLEGGYSLPEVRLHTAVVERAGEPFTCAWEE
ncbi:hypothetical protein [Halomonas sp. LBP4]|uniref:hypothetical protein n=1 Tax=Halomonas sp. LBP4 TaxID=2044917 RepID=UPI000D770C1D|nr:hypothetical protein [Halomonas sp. LBP4]PXX95978.1 hypothetical protein CR157_17455 [Halomonas sp. LBP4]